MLRFVIVFSALSTFFSLHCEASDTAEYHYYRESKVLQLKSNEIAIWGEAVDSGRELPIEGWRICDMSITTNAEAEREIANALERGASFASPVFQGQLGGYVIVTPTILVRFIGTVEAAQDVIERFPELSISSTNFGGSALGFKLHCSEPSGYSVLDLANRLALTPGVLYAEPNFIISGQGASLPTDFGFPSLWGLHNTGAAGGLEDFDMDAPEAWDLTLGDPGVRVALLDTGVQLDHPDFAGLPGVDFTSDGPGDGSPVNLCDNHGTPMAGCISATINNEVGIVGIAPLCTTVSLRTFISLSSCDTSWDSESSWTVDALTWAHDQGIEISNNSNTYGPIASAAIDEAYLETHLGGMTHFAAAGNQGMEVVSYPASLPSVHAVTATRRYGTFWGGSNTGPEISLSAPGEQIYSLDRTGGAGFAPGGYVDLFGTSLSSAYCAGVAALVLSADPTLSPANLGAILESSATDLGAIGWDESFGFGMVNAHAALTHPRFIRGDADANGAVDALTDAVCILSYLFIPGAPSPQCRAGADVDADGVIGLGDPVYLLSFQFVNGLKPTEPYPNCGSVPPHALGCDSSGALCP